jgi:hypothetical protein
VADRWECLDRLAAEVQAPQTRFAGLPLGVVPQSDYEQRKVRLGRGDAVLCYTDAFIEAQRPDGSFLGTEGLLELVTAASPFNDGADLMSRLIHSVRALDPQNLNQDDSTLVLFRTTGVRFHFRDQLLAPFRYLFLRGSDTCHIVAPHSRLPKGSAPRGS